MDLVEIQRADYSTEMPDVQQIRDWISVVFETLNRVPLALTIRVVCEEEMTELNRRYRGQDQATNVLSFPFRPLPGICTDLLGDIVVCGPMLEREAAFQHKQPIGHWAHMIVHGMLHLFGYDHQNNQEAIVMETLETSVLDQLGFPDPYQVEYNSGTKSHAQT
jgi:probable rRNA maturation factor